MIPEDPSLLGRCAACKSVLCLAIGMRGDAIIPPAPMACRSSGQGEAIAIGAAETVRIGGIPPAAQGGIVASRHQFAGPGKMI